MGANKIDEEELIAVVMGAAPKEYMSVITTEQRIQTTGLTVNHLEEVMMQHWRQMNTKTSEESNNEVALVATNTFNGICYNCQQKGHRANKCPNEKQPRKDKGKKTKAKCNNCGKEGHTEENCWELARNADKRPKWYKKSSGNEQANVAHNVEVLLAAVQFPTKLKFLENPNVWVGDTGATVHVTRYKMGMTNTRQLLAGDVIMM